MRLSMTSPSFKICQLTDIHLGNYPFNSADIKTMTQIDQLLDRQPFDLIMLTGDLIWGKQVTNPNETLGALFEMLNRHPIPVAITYGNHDTEGPFTRKDLRAIETRLAHPADKHHAMVVYDRESYTLEVYRNQHLAHICYVWDGGAYSHWQKDDEYAAIEPEQINWFLQLPYNRSEANLDLGFLHIPLPEYQSTAKVVLSGVQNEPICSPKTSSGLFYTILREQNVKALFAGHDHDNNFTSQLRGIQLNYGNVTGYNCYGKLPRGIRKIEIESGMVSSEVITFNENPDLTVSGIE